MTACTCKYPVPYLHNNKYTTIAGRLSFRLTVPSTKLREASGRLCKSRILKSSQYCLLYNLLNAMESERLEIAISLRSRRLKTCFHWLRSRSRSGKSASDLVSRKRCHELKGIGVGRIGTVPFSSDSAYDLRTLMIQ